MAAKRVWAAILSVVLAVAVLVGFSLASEQEPASALSGSEFRAGNLMSDDNFYLGSAMFESQIQALLGAGVSKCESGYTCLKDFVQATYSTSTDCTFHATPSFSALQSGVQ